MNLSYKSLKGRVSGLELLRLLLNTLPGLALLVGEKFTELFFDLGLRFVNEGQAIVKTKLSEIMKCCLSQIDAEIFAQVLMYLNEWWHLRDLKTTLDILSDSDF